MNKNKIISMIAFTMIQFCGAVVVTNIAGNEVYTCEDPITLGALTERIHQETGLGRWQVAFALGINKLTNPTEEIPADTQLTLIVTKSLELWARNYTSYDTTGYRLDVRRFEGNAKIQFSIRNIQDPENTQLVAQVVVDCNPEVTKALFNEDNLIFNSTDPSEPSEPIHRLMLAEIASLVTPQNGVRIGLLHHIYHDDINKELNCFGIEFKSDEGNRAANHFLILLLATLDGYLF